MTIRETYVDVIKSLHENHVQLFTANNGREFLELYSDAKEPVWLGFLAITAEFGVHGQCLAAIKKCVQKESLAAIAISCRTDPPQDKVRQNSLSFGGLEPHANSFCDGVQELSDQQYLTARGAPRVDFINDLSKGLEGLNRHFVKLAIKTYYIFLNDIKQSEPVFYDALNLTTGPADKSGLSADKWDDPALFANSEKYIAKIKSGEFKPNIAPGMEEAFAKEFGNGKKKRSNP